MHQAIDIIRDKADQDYLDAIASHCNSSVSNENAANSLHGEPVLSKQLIYLDRNNTPDVWSDIQKTIEKSNKDSKKQSVRPYKTILILPEQHIDFDRSSYTTQNPICPQMIYECIKRIFGRKSHDCLSSENKPKVVEVILKFARLYDGVDFSNDESMR